MVNEQLVCRRLRRELCAICGRLFLWRRPLRERHGGCCSESSSQISSAAAVAAAATFSAPTCGQLLADGSCAQDPQRSAHAPDLADRPARSGPRS